MNIYIKQQYLNPQYQITLIYLGEELLDSKNREMPEWIN